MPSVLCLTLLALSPFWPESQLPSLLSPRDSAAAPCQLLQGWATDGCQASELGAHVRKLYPEEVRAPNSPCLIQEQKETSYKGPFFSQKQQKQSTGKQRADCFPRTSVDRAPWYPCEYMFLSSFLPFFLSFF